MTLYFPPSNLPSCWKMGICSLFDRCQNPPLSGQLPCMGSCQSLGPFFSYWLGCDRPRPAALNSSQMLPGNPPILATKTSEAWATVEGDLDPVLTAPHNLCWMRGTLAFTILSILWMTFSTVVLGGITHLTASLTHW